MYAITVIGEMRECEDPALALTDNRLPVTEARQQLLAVLDLLAEVFTVRLRSRKLWTVRAQYPCHL